MQGCPSDCRLCAQARERAALTVPNGFVGQERGRETFGALFFARPPSPRFPPLVTRERAKSLASAEAERERRDESVLRFVVPPCGQEAKRPPSGRAEK